MKKWLLVMLVSCSFLSSCAIYLAKNTCPDEGSYSSTVVTNEGDTNINVNGKRIKVDRDGTVYINGKRVQE